MRCPNCSHEGSKVTDSRSKEKSEAIYRRRECKNCGRRFTTHERVPLHDLTVVKSTGEQEPFDREKLFRSLKVALPKRPVDEDRIQRSANTIQRTLEKNAAKKVATETIGQMALERLAELDKVAYVRFASVYTCIALLDTYADGYPTASHVASGGGEADSVVVRSC